MFSLSFFGCFSFLNEIWHSNSSKMNKTNVFWKKSRLLLLEKKTSHIVLLLIILIIALVSSHVQTITRFGVKKKKSCCFHWSNNLVAFSPIVYWMSSRLFLKGGNKKCIQHTLFETTVVGRWQFLILLFFIGYSIIGTILFTSFYPWTWARARSIFHLKNIKFLFRFQCNTLDRSHSLVGVVEMVKHDCLLNSDPCWFASSSLVADDQMKKKFWMHFFKKIFCEFFFFCWNFEKTSSNHQNVFFLFYYFFFWFFI